MKITVIRPNFEDRVFDDDSLGEEGRYELNTKEGVLEVYKVGPYSSYGTSHWLVFACAGEFDAIQE